jgi:hypothetical protein
MWGLKNTNGGHYGKGGPIGTKVYFNGVTKEEQAKIEFEDTLEKFAYDFEKNNAGQIYQDLHTNRFSLI